MNFKEWIQNESIENFRTFGNQTIPVLVNPSSEALAKFSVPFIKSMVRMGGLVTEDQENCNLYIFNRNKITHDLMLENLYGPKYNRLSTDIVKFAGFYISPNWKVIISGTYNTPSYISLLKKFSAVIQQAEIKYKEITDDQQQLFQRGNLQHNDLYQINPTI